MLVRSTARLTSPASSETNDLPTTGEVEELRRLRKENAELRRANEILKAASALLAQEIDPTRRPRSTIAPAAPTAPPRVHATLHRRGVPVSRKRVERLTREHDLQGAFLRKKWRTSSTRQNPAATPAPDLVNRDFTAPAPNRLWVADATRVRVGRAWSACPCYSLSTGAGRGGCRRLAHAGSRRHVGLTRAGLGVAPLAPRRVLPIVRCCAKAHSLHQWRWVIHQPTGQVENAVRQCVICRE